MKAELARYSAVIHVEVPALSSGYEKNTIRRETVADARKIDRRITAGWKSHPHRLTVATQAGFLDKLAFAIELLRNEVPICCQTHLHSPSSASTQ